MFVSTPPTSRLDRLALAIYASDARITKEKAYIMARLRLGIKKSLPPRHSSSSVYHPAASASDQTQQ